MTVLAVSNKVTSAFDLQRSVHFIRAETICFQSVHFVRAESQYASEMLSDRTCQS